MDEIEKERRAGRRARYQAKHLSPDQPLMSQGTLGDQQASSEGLQELILGGVFADLKDRQLLRWVEICLGKGQALSKELMALLDERGLLPADFEETNPGLRQNRAWRKE